MTLTSMTAFVLENYKNAPIEEYHKVNERFADKVINYAKFLSRPLELWMFIPCKLVDGEWVMLKRLSYFDFPRESITVPDSLIKFDEYHKAKRNVLFEGFEVKNSKIHENRQFIGWEIYNPSIFINIGNGWQKPEFPDFETIEDLLSFSQEITLTPTAIKEIEG